MGKNSRNPEKQHKSFGFRLSGKTETGAPKLVDMTCSHCGGVLQMNDATHAKCPFCGAVFLIDQPEDLHVNIYLPDHSGLWRRFGKWILIAALAAGVLVCCVLLNVFMVSLPSWMRPQRIDPVVQSFYEDVLGAQYRNLSQQDFDRIKYVDVLGVDRGKVTTYHICYSFDDFAEYESDADFAATLRYWNGTAEDYDPILSFTKLCGLTYVNLSGLDYHYPKDAPVTCVKARDLNQVEKQVCNGSDTKKARIEKMVLTLEQSADLGGYREYPNLKDLSLNINLIGQKETVLDVSPLAMCTQLEKLSFKSSCSCVGLADLSKLQNLRELRFPDVTVEQCGFLNQMPQLEILALGAGKSGDMSNLRGLEHLKRLHLSGDEVRLSDLPEFNELEVLTCVVESQEEFDQVVRFPTLKRCGLKLDLPSSASWDVSALGRMENLEVVELSSQFDAPDITHLECLLNLKKLEGLVISAKTQSYRRVYVDTDALADDVALRYLNVTRCFLYDAVTEEPDFEMLGRFQNLEDLTLYSCRLEDIGVLGTLKQLRQLNVEDNQISDFQPLSDCPKLTKLYLGGNPILEPELPEQVQIVYTRTLNGL